MPRLLPLPGDTEPILPLASELLSAITKSKLDRHKRIRLSESAFPEVIVSKAVAERASKAFHVLLAELEPLGIRFQKFKGTLDCGYFERGRERLYFTITEDLVRPDGSKMGPEWKWTHEKASACGFLSFSIKTDRYYDLDKKEWSESVKVPLEKILPKVVVGIRQHYIESQERRERERAEAERHRAAWIKQMEEFEWQEAIRLQEEEERKHSAAIAAATGARRGALFHAAENWRRSNTLLQFISACETRWKSEMGELTSQQIAWLKWSGDLALEISPFSDSYPDPAIDGDFDPASIPFGGPYPRTRSFK